VKKKNMPFNVMQSHLWVWMCSTENNHSAVYDTTSWMYQNKTCSYRQQDASQHVQFYFQWETWYQIRIHAPDFLNEGET